MILLQILRKYWQTILTVVLSLSLAWYLWRPEPPVQEKPFPETIQADGSKVVEKVPNAKEKPTAIIPKGSVVERVVKFTVKAKTPVSEVSGRIEVSERFAAKAMQVSETKAPLNVVDACFCPPIDVEMVLVRNEDQTRSVVLKSDNGIILNAIDIPVEAAKRIEAQPVWAAGAVADPFKQTFGAFIDRDLGFMRVGLQLNQRNQGDIPNQIWLKAGIRF